MTEEERKNIVREFLAALAARDLEKALSFLAEDATWKTPAGTYRGKEELKPYLAWEFEMVPSLTVTETGVGLMVQGNQAVIEHTLAGPIRGEPCEWLGMCAYEFEDGKIQALRTVYDRLSLLQQSATGWLESKIVDLVASQAESGLE
jgi:ketosteroid isomerase-like protein